MSASWKTICSWNTGYSADSVEWCPIAPHHDVLVCGTYQLDKKTEDDNHVSNQKRLGRIYSFKIDKHTESLAPVQSIDTSGILDQKWCFHTINDSPVLAVVTSEGLLQLYRLSGDDSMSLKLWVEGSVGDNVLALSLDWSTNKLSTVEPNIVVSDSSGSLTVFTVIDNGLHKIGTWKGHDYEAWIAAYNYWNPNIFYSGGDDCLFKCFDIRVSDAALTTNRNHEAGVTAIRSHVGVEHQLLTGSYDEKVRLWDARNLRRCVAETNVNGGVWRLKYHPRKLDTVLAACMYGGFRVLNVQQKDITVLYEYLDHDSIAYGADWSFNNDYVATCSFYDCKMNISEILFT